MQFPSRAAAVTLLVGLLAGCGTGGSNPAGDAEQQVRAVLEAYGAAQRGRDFSGACDLLTQRARAQVVEGVAQGRSTAGITCERAFQAVYGQAQLAEALDAANAAVTVSTVDVLGDRATVAYRNPGGAHTARLVREGGAWHIDTAG